MLRKITTWLKGSTEDRVVEAELEISETGEVNKKDLVSVLKIAGLTGLAAILTTLATSLSDVEVSDKTVVILIPLITATLHAISRWINTNIYVNKVKVK